MDDGSKQNISFALYHDFNTDIALWRPESQLFQIGNLFGDWFGQHFGTANRLRPAMLSALFAILKAVAHVLNIDDRELGGLLYPVDQQCTGFVFFDDVSGGAGHVLPLILTGDDDQQRINLIKRIIKKALEICVECDECGEGLHSLDGTVQYMPLTREDFAGLSLEDRCNYRVRRSCYKCLRSYNNQRYHYMLDRFDAALVLNALLC